MPPVATVPNASAVPAVVTRSTWSAVPWMFATFAVALPVTPITERATPCRNFASVTALFVIPLVATVPHATAVFAVLFTST